jgi:hypothetical protein
MNDIINITNAPSGKKLQDFNRGRQQTTHFNHLHPPYFLHDSAQQETYGNKHQNIENQLGNNLIIEHVITPEREKLKLHNIRTMPK